MIGPLLAMLAQVTPAAPAPTPLLDATPVADPILAEQRGGFRLPNGVDVSLTVQSQTTVNGAVLLRTVFSLDQQKPSLAIYVPRNGETVPVGASASAASAGQAMAPTISYDRNGGLQVTSVVVPSVSVSGGGSSTDVVPAGLTQAAAGAVTDAGTLSETATNGTRQVTLQGSDFTITHLSGNAFGSAIANSGSDRTIDTQTTVSINLGNAGPDVIGSAMFRVQDMALDAVALRGN
jgi:hypothetical protein